VSVLSKREIFKRLHKSIKDEQSLIITPLLDAEEAFDEDSVDLRLGCYFLLPRTPPRPFLYPGSTPSEHSNLRVHVPFGNPLVVPAHQTVLGATLEFIKLPYDLSGQILTKSSIARSFIVIETAPWIHPNYRGCLTLEIANVSNTPLLLYPGLSIGQLILLTLDAAVPSPTLTSTYFGAVLPEPPPAKDLTAQFKRIGITKLEIPKLYPRGGEP
jgi:dCTP deaminase